MVKLDPDRKAAALLHFYAVLLSGITINHNQVQWIYRHSYDIKKMYYLCCASETDLGIANL